MFKKGFTIIELLVVICVIGILATVTVISFIGINNKAIAASLKLDLKTMSVYSSSITSNTMSTHLP